MYIALCVSLLEKVEYQKRVKRGGHQVHSQTEVMAADRLLNWLNCSVALSEQQKSYLAHFFDEHILFHSHSLVFDRPVMLLHVVEVSDPHELEGDGHQHYEKRETDHLYNDYSKSVGVEKHIAHDLDSCCVEPEHFHIVYHLVVFSPDVLTFIATISTAIRYTVQVCNFLNKIIDWNLVLSVKKQLLAKLSRCKRRPLYLERLIRILYLVILIELIE